MNKLLLKLLVLVTFPFSTSAGDAGKFYVGIHGEGLVTPNIGYTTYLGPNHLETGKIKSDVGYGLGLAVGYNLTDSIRTEVEFVYRYNDTELINSKATKYSEITFHNVTAMLNGYYDFFADKQFSPYIGAGIGATSNSNMIEVNNGNPFSYQLMTGINLNIDENNTINLGYRYFTTLETIDSRNIFFGTDIKDKYTYETHAIEIGYKHSF
ncbi:MAG: hypothetical protein K0R98_1512 [Rickettsiaceae bacterium]|jgi:opacity protein-like surface antigen|nr:hypothetical protein [Rickettsiaceae bacterium]